HGCPMAQMTLQMGVERVIKATVPEIESVVAVD
ncbi:MAG: NifU family protein, partial [Abditibacteriota bacterium]|nr:NifU family protein [Abditibacteriota bacterium]